MLRLSPDTLSRVLRDPSHIRSLCVLAHVDHGKTTLSDFLISHNGHISSKLAGRIRYLDCREDEQNRMITMKSSSITLVYQESPRNGGHGVGESSSDEDEYLIHLVDSPGHVDFSVEVSTAVRLCDGCLILVDVIEGVCVQTHAVLEQAWREGLTPILVLNKIDRLLSELHFSPWDCFKLLNRILEQVNAIQSTFSRADLLRQSEGENQASDHYDEDEILIDSDAFFSPIRGNVVFASAFHGWAFRLQDFSKMYAEKLGVNDSKLTRALWGNYFYNPKTKLISRKPTSPKQTPLFVQCIMQNIDQVYSAVLSCDEERTKKIVSSLQLEVSKRDLEHRDRTVALQAVMRRWLPLSDCVLGVVIQIIPPPSVAQASRLDYLLPQHRELPAESHDSLDELRSSVESCNSSPSAPLYAFISKLIEIDDGSSSSSHVSIPKSREVLTGNEIPLPISNTNIENDDRSTVESSHSPRLESDSDEYDDADLDQFVGFGRIFSGTIQVGDIVHVCGARYSPLSPTENIVAVPVKKLYILMGKNVEPVHSVSAGNIFGIGGVSRYVLKYATLTSDPRLPAFPVLRSQASPIVRIALEPENPANMSVFVRGLRLLCQADPSVEAYIQDTGEHVIVCAGEVHAERCIRDLREQFARIPIHSSSPIVGFRETIVEPSSEETSAKTCEAWEFTANHALRIHVTCFPLPSCIAEVLEQLEEELRNISQDGVADERTETAVEEISNAFLKAGEEWMNRWDQIWSFGPKRCGSNILFNGIPDYTPPLWTLGSAKRDTDMSDFGFSSVEDISTILRRREGDFVSGFNLATGRGPLCEEPVTRVCFVIDSLEFDPSILPTVGQDPYGSFGGQIISATKDACRSAFLACPVRLVEAMYRCIIQAPSEVLGRVYSVLSRRRARVVDEAIEDGTSIFTIESFLPVAESFGFAQELRDKASGAANPQIALSHWENIEQDPFYIPATEEELEEWGDTDVTPNIARKYMNYVRKRKGLLIEEKIVQAAEKQRTLARKK